MMIVMISVTLISITSNHCHRHHHYMYNHYYDRRRRYLRRDCHDRHLYRRRRHERRRAIIITSTIAMSIPKTCWCKLLPVSWGRAPKPPCHVGWGTCLPRIALLEAA